MTKETRPWGDFTVLTEDPRYKIKRICVKPGKRLSLQSHARRSEHWVILVGEGIVTQDNHDRLVQQNDQIFIPFGQKHRIHNTGPSPLEFIEVQTGTYFGEDDIIRYEDDFGRN